MLDIFLSRQERLEKDKLHDVVIVYSGGISPDPDNLTKMLSEEFQENLRPDEVLIIVANTAYNEAKEMYLKSRYFGRFLQNNSSVQFFLCSFDISGKQTDCSHISFENRSLKFNSGGEKPQIPFHDFTRQIIADVYKNHAIEQNTYGTYHYIKPSGKHTDLFLRASKMFKSTKEISFFALAVLPYLPRDSHNETIVPKHILIDTPLIIALAQGLVDLVKIVGCKLDVPIQITSFGSFPGLRNGSNEQTYIQDLPGDSIFLISASTTGGLVKKLQSIAKFPDSSFIHFLYLRASLGEKTEISVACDLEKHPKLNPFGISQSPTNYDAGDCSLCKNGSYAIKLLGDHFDPAPPEPSPVVISIGDAPNGTGKFKELIARTITQEVLRVGTSKADRAKKYRHFFVDEQKLFNSDQINKRLNYILDLYFPKNPQAMIYIDDASKYFADNINDYVQAADLEVFSREEIDDYLPIKNKSTKPIIVVAAVVESGRTLLEVSRDLRSQAKGAPIIYLVLLAKYVSKEKLSGLRLNLDMTSGPARHNVVVVEELILPISTSLNAWQIEEEFIAKNQLISSKNSFWKKRFKRIAIKNELLDDPLFLTNSDNEKSALSLQPGFVFWPSGPEFTQDCSDADVYFFIASILQNLRTREHSTGKTTLISTIYFQGFLAAENFSRFNDNILQVCLLRAALPSELNYSHHKGESRQIARLIKRILRASEKRRGGAAMEFLLALGTERLKLHDKDLNDIFSTEVKSIKQVRVRNFFKTVRKILKNKKELS